MDIFSGHIVWEHEIFKFEGQSYGVFYIHSTTIKPIICKKDYGKDNILKNSDIYYRYGGRTQKIQYSELEAIINERIQQTNRQWQELVDRIGKAGPQNAVVLDTAKGLIEHQSKIFMIDEKLTKQFQWLKEGEFNERNGAKALKLIGSVEPIDTVEVIKKIKEDQLKAYPLSATELVNEIKRKNPDIKLNRIYEIISENGIKNDKDYSSYVFRNKKQQDEFEKTGRVPKGTPCIYKKSAIELIQKIYQNEVTTA